MCKKMAFIFKYLSDMQEEKVLEKPKYFFTLFWILKKIDYLSSK